MQLSDPRTAGRRYTFAVGAFLLGLIARMVISPALGGTAPYITFFPAVILSAWYGGFGPGIITTILSLAAAVFVLLPPAYSLRIHTVPDATGAVVFVLVSTFICRLQETLRRRAAEAQNSLSLLLSSESKRERERRWYVQTLASIGDGVIATGTEGRIQFVNAVAAKLIGEVEANLIGRSITDAFRIVDEATGSTIDDPIARVMRDGSTLKLSDSTVLVTSSGANIPISDSAAPIKDDTGNIIGAVLVFRDISERRSAGEALRESEETFRLATESAHTGTWRNELRTKRVTWSPELERIFGLEPGEFDGTEEAFFTFIHPADKEGVQDEIMSAICDRREYEIEFRFRRKGDQAVRWMLARGRAYYDPAGNPLRLAGIAVDETDRKAAENALRTLNRNLEITNEDLRQFAYAASHDLQEPLRMVVSYTQLLEQRYKNKIDEQANVFIKYAVEGALRLEHLLKGLLEYYRAGEIREAREPIDCNHALRLALNNLDSAIRESAATVTCDELPTCSAHEVAIVQLFQNLIGNAVKYRSTQPPRVHVAARRNMNEWQFTVSDNGIGIDGKYFKQIFGVFKRLHDHTLPGTGIGLAICSRIVERYGGRIWAESEAGNGSGFHFTIPDPQ